MAWPMSKDRADRCGMSDLKETEKRNKRRDSRRAPSEWQAYLGLSPSDEGLHRLQRLASRFQDSQKSQARSKSASPFVTRVPQHCRVALGKTAWTNRVRAAVAVGLTDMYKGESHSRTS